MDRENILKDMSKLREVCQLPRAQYDMWYQRTITRKLSMYITVFFLRMGINANTATVIFAISGIISGLFFAVGGRFGLLCGVFMLQAWYILDHVDGEIARFNEESSFTGIYFDYMTHYIVHPIIFLGLGIGFYRTTGSGYYAVLGVLGAFGEILFGLVSDIKDLIIFRDSKKFSVPPGKIHARPATLSVLMPQSMSEKVYFFCTFPVIMIVITFTGVFDSITGLFFTRGVFVFYVILLNMIWFLRLAVFIKERKIDAEIAAIKEG